MYPVQKEIFHQNTSIAILNSCVPVVCQLSILRQWLGEEMEDGKEEESNTMGEGSRYKEREGCARVKGEEDGGKDNGDRCWMG